MSIWRGGGWNGFEYHLINEKTFWHSWKNISIALIFFQNFIVFLKFLLQSRCFFNSVEMFFMIGEMLFLKNLFLNKIIHQYACLSAHSNFANIIIMQSHFENFHLIWTVHKSTSVEIDFYVYSYDIGSYLNPSIRLYIN